MKKDHLTETQQTSPAVCGQQELNARILHWYKKICKARLFPLKPFRQLDQDSKRPLHTGWQKEDLTVEGAMSWLTHGNSLGWILRDTDLVIDVDVPTPGNGGHKSDGRPAFDRLIEQTGLNIGIAPVIVSPTGGQHIYLHKPAEASVKQRLAEFPGIDFKSRGGYMVIPPSPH